MVDRSKRMRLGDLLQERGIVSAAQLDIALLEQRRAYRPLGAILISLGFVQQRELAQLLSEQMGIPLIDRGSLAPDPLVLAAVDLAFVRETGALPIGMQGDVLQVAMVDPLDLPKVALVRERFPMPLAFAAITEDDLFELAREYLATAPSRVAEILGAAELGRDELQGTPIEALSAALIEDGIRRGATDVHIEPEENVARVRYRIDGMLQPGESLPRALTDAVLSRIKILARLDISERRRPQDGRMRIEVDRQRYELRVSSRPVADGENLVLRVLDRSSGSKPLENLGFAADVAAALQTVAQRPHGLFLVTGPTGSGKSTTLYSLLGCVDAMHRNVATIEDPIEYRMPLVRQSQVDNAVGFGFQEGLRALLRQDPDVILVGEVRDAETASMAVRASMTGHLVLTTLHTNDAIGAIPRLCDLGVEPYLLEDSLIGVLAQRLVRRLCSGCSVPGEPTHEEALWLGPVSVGLRRARGCPRCNESGYSGRIAMSELFLPDDTMEHALREGTDLPSLRRLAAASGFRGIEHDGRRLVGAGLTSREEVERTCRSHRFTRAERTAA